MDTSGENIDRYELFWKHQWIVRVFLAKGFAKYPILRSYDGFESELTKELWGVALRFDDSKGVKFSTLAFWRMSGAIIDLAKVAYRQGLQLPGRREDLSDRMNASMGDFEVGKDPYMNLVRKRFVQGALDFIQTQLGAFARDIVMGHLFEGTSLRGIARRNDCSYSSVRKIYLEALGKIRAHLSTSSPLSEHEGERFSPGSGELVR